MSLVSRINPRDSIIILTGAGISAESGLETFRGSDGLWAGHRIEDVATPEAFARNPALVHEFYNMRRAALLSPEIAPNPAHHALAKLEQEWDGNVLLVTQNIDNLHERAGSRNLVHMHGEALSAFCFFCLEKAACHNPLSVEIACGHCKRSGGMRPDIVWFGEMPYEMERIYAALDDCDVFISIGTSGHVYPAAGFCHHARHGGALTIEINLEPSHNSNIFHESRQGRAGELVPRFVDQLLGKR